MKRITTFLLLALFAVSCSDSEDLTFSNSEAATTAAGRLASNNNGIRPNLINPQLLQKVIWNPGLPTEKQWNFFPNGLLKEVTSADGTVLQQFNYDGQNNLITILSQGNTVEHSFTYDAFHYLTSVDGDNVVYDPANHWYVMDFPNPAPSPEYDFYDRSIFLVNTQRMLTDERKEYLSSDGNYYISGVSAAYAPNGNVTYCGYEQGEATYTHDNHTNPLQQAILPISRAMGLTNFQSYTGKWMQGEYVSTNNVTQNGYDSDGPDLDVYTFVYNAGGLPQQRTTASYYNNTLENTFVSAVYYYQGDVIP